jgi:hypothetical protein
VHANAAIADLVANRQLARPNPVKISMKSLRDEWRHFSFEVGFKFKSAAAYAA